MLRSWKIGLSLCHHPQDMYSSNSVPRPTVPSRRFAPRRDGYSSSTPRVSLRSTSRRPSAGASRPHALLLAGENTSKYEVEHIGAYRPRVRIERQKAESGSDDVPYLGTTRGARLDSAHLLSCLDAYTSRGYDSDRSFFDDTHTRMLTKLNSLRYVAGYTVHTVYHSMTGCNRFWAVLLGPTTTWLHPGPQPGPLTNRYEPVLHASVVRS